MGEGCCERVRCLVEVVEAAAVLVCVCVCVCMCVYVCVHVCARACVCCGRHYDRGNMYCASS